MNSLYLEFIVAKNEIMDRFQQLRVYIAVAEEGGFAAAARRLHMSPPSVTRAVSSLEEALGVKLLERTTRHVRVTEPGQRYLEDARQVLAQLEAADDTAAGISAAPRGHLAVTAPVLFGRQYVLPGVLRYLREYPEMTVDTMFLDRVVNLIEEGQDVGVRIGALADSSLRALRVGTVRLQLVAAPSYLAAHGEPCEPAALSRHTLIATLAGNFGRTWQFASRTAVQPLRISPRLTVTTNDAAVEAAVSGFGVARLLSYQVAEAVRNGQLQVLMPEFELPAQPVHIVHRQSRYGSTKVRTFIDMLAAQLRDDPGLR